MSRTLQSVVKYKVGQDLVWVLADVKRLVVVDLCFTVWPSSSMHGYNGYNIVEKDTGYQYSGVREDQLEETDAV